MYNEFVQLLLGLSIITLLITLVVISFTTCVLVLFAYKTLTGQELLKLPQKTKESDDNLPEEDKSVPLDQFTPDFTKNIGVRYVDEEEPKEDEVI